MASIHQIIINALTDLSVCIVFPVFYASVFSMRYTKRRYLLIFPAVMYFIVNPLIYLAKFPQFLQFFTGLGCMLGGVFIFSNDKPLKKILYTVIPYAVNIVTSMIYLFLRTLFMPEYEVVFGNIDYIDLVFYTIGLILPLFLISRLVQRKKPNISDLTIIYVITTILVQMIAMTFILYVYTINLDRVVFMTALISYMVISLALNILVIRYIVHISRENSRRELVENQYELLCAQYGELRGSYVAYKKLRHDLKDHVRIIEGLSRRGKTDELTEYTGRLIENWDTLSARTFCDVPAVDVVLADKYSVAAAKNIKADFVVSGVSEVGADSVYLCSIFSNLLNNAIEAAEQCGEYSYVELRSGISMGNLVITCRNGIPQTRREKKDPELHGYGLHIISELSKLLGGSFAYSSDEDTFTATVILPVREKEEGA